MVYQPLSGLDKYIDLLLVPLPLFALDSATFMRPMDVVRCRLTVS